jgi:Ca2+-binding EF-hand superfamily protein
MKLHLILTVALVGVAAMPAQERERGPRDGFRPEGGMMRFNPVLAALDADHDGVISAAELAKAPAALKALDKDGDGKLTMEEMRPNFGPQGRGGPGGPGGPGAPGGADPEQMVKTLMAFDRNQDGKLAKDEVPERMQGIFARADANHDGLLTEDEIRKASATQASRQGGPGRGPEGGMRRMDPVTAALDADHDGVISAEELRNAPGALKALDKNSDGKITEDEVRPNFGGRGGPGGFGRPPERQ